MKRVFQKLSILLALMAGIWCFSSCNELNNGTGGGINSYSVTIYVYENNTISPITIPVEEGSTLNSLTGDLYTTPTYKDYEFEGFVTEDGSTFTASTPVTKDIVLYAKFKKTAQNNEGTTSTTTTETKITDGSSSTSTQTTTYENGAQTVETSTTTENKDGSKTEVESTSTTNYQTGETTSTTTETVTSKDGTSKTTETKESSSTDESGNSVKTTETSVTETIDGKSQTTTEKVEVTENAETGDVTTKTTTTDSNGKTETKEDTTTYNDKQAHYWIMKGINELLKFQQAGSYAGYLDYIVEAKKDFAKAYEVEPTSDEAKVYSAINDWTDMVTNPAIAKFLSEHLGVTNYPDNFKDVLSGEWLAEDSYVMGSGSRYWSGYTISEVTNPDSDYFYDYYVKCSSTDAEGDFSTSNYYLKTTIPNTNNVYVDQNTEDAYNYCKDGFESVIFGSVNPNLPYYRTEAKNFV